MERDQLLEDDERPAPSELNQELTQTLIDVGRWMAFTAVTEYPVPGGRLDVVWLWQPPSPIPGVVDAIPVAGFEIESSWRTRKHVKGDLLNLQDAGVALGVIVLAGADARDESLRRFAESLVDRSGPTVLVWTHDDVRALGNGQATITEVETAAATSASTRPADVPTAEHAHTGKYRPLWDWLLRQDRREIRISFSDLERQAGITLPESARAHVAHWHSYQGSAVARAIIDAGWHTNRVELNAGRVSLLPGAASGRP